MAIKISGTTIIDDSRVMSNIASANIVGTMKSAGLLDSSNRTLTIRNSANTVVWGN
jgi:hypothetical protein